MGLTAAHTTTLLSLGLVGGSAPVNTEVKLVERCLVGGTWPWSLSMTEGQLLCWCGLHP